MTNWSWNAHIVGGKYRRLLSMDGPDHGSLVEALGAFGGAFAENPAAGGAFNEACDSHQDNLWSVLASQP